MLQLLKASPVEEHQCEQVSSSFLGYPGVNPLLSHKHGALLHYLAMIMVQLYMTGRVMMNNQL